MSLLHFSYCLISNCPQIHYAFVLYFYSQVPNGLSDTQFLSQLLIHKTQNEILKIFSKIKGPWSIIYYQKQRNQLYFGRDVIGRHSLLWSKHKTLQGQRTIKDVDNETMSGKCPLQVKDQVKCQSDGNIPMSNRFVITSVGNGCNDLDEIPAYGIYLLDYNLMTKTDDKLPIELFAWNSISKHQLDTIDVVVNDVKLPSPIEIPLNMSLPDQITEENIKSQADEYHDFTTLSSSATFDVHCEQLTTLLTQAIVRRTRACPSHCLNCSNNWHVPRHGSSSPATLVSNCEETIETRTSDCPAPVSSCSGSRNCTHSRIAVLFSGGLDSSVLALLLDRCLPKDESIDLINVAFPQRVVPQPQKRKVKNKSNMGNSNVHNHIIKKNNGINIVDSKLLNPCHESREDLSKINVQCTIPLTPAQCVSNPPTTLVDNYASALNDVRINSTGDANGHIEIADSNLSSILVETNAKNKAVMTSSEPAASIPDVAVHYNAPDRETGISTHARLILLCPHRTFNFVKVTALSKNNMVCPLSINTLYLSKILFRNISG